MSFEAYAKKMAVNGLSGVHCRPYINYFQLKQLGIKPCKVFQDQVHKSIRIRYYIYRAYNLYSD